MGGPILIGCQPCNTLSESLEVERYSVIKMHIRNNLTLFLHFSFIVSTMLNVFYRDYLVSKCLWAFPVLQKSLIIKSIAGLISMVADCQVTCHRRSDGVTRFPQWFDFIRAVNPVASVMIFFHGFIANRVSFIENICFFNVFSIKDINPWSPQNFLTRFFL